MAEQVVAYGGAELRRELGRVVLRHDRDGVAEEGKKDEGARVHEDVGAVAARDADVYDLRHDDGDDELEDGLQALEGGREHALEVVPAQITPELEHTTPTCS